MADAFQGGTIRVPVRGEEAVVSKEAVVTGEVVIDKEQTTERQQVTDTVRRERVGVDENTREASATAGVAATATTRGMAQAGVAAGTASGRAVEGMDVVGSDGASLGQVKEVREGDFLLDRPSARDYYVPFSAIRQITGNQVVLTVGSGEIDDQGWPNPSLF